MRPLKLSISIIAQNYNKLSSKEYSEAYSSSEIAKQIFGLKVPFLLDQQAELEYSARYGAVNATPAEYYWTLDYARIYSRRIKTLCKKYELDCNLFTQFCLCHEMGHAREQRLFEEIGFFPNTINKPYHLFIAGICDYSINKELLKHGLKNPFERRAFLDKDTQRSASITTKAERDELHFNLLLNLPLTLDVYDYGGLTNEEKAGLKEGYEKLIGNKWEKAHTKLRQIDFFNAESKLDTIVELYGEILEQYLELRRENTRLLRLRNPLPDFWHKSAYNVLIL
jgi:hypothetical protein